MILIICIVLLTVLLVSYKVFEGNLARPSVIFNAGFFFACVIAYSYRVEWNLSTMHWKTMFMITVGSILAFLTDFVVSKQNLPIYEENNDDFVYIEKKRLIIFAVFQVFAYFFYTKYKIAVVGSALSLSEAIGEVNQMIKFDDFTLHLPMWVNVLYLSSQGAGLLLSFLIPIYFHREETDSEIKIWMILNFILSAVGTLLQGGRMPLLTIIIPTVVAYLLILNQNYVTLGAKQILKFLLPCFIFLISFVEIGNLIGRERNDNTITDVIAVYCGAEIANLDDHITSPPSTKDDGYIFSNTFWKLYNSYAVIFSTSPPSYDFNSYYPFNFRDKQPLGNVYTCYANYYLDLGIGGVLFVVIAMLIICIVYNKMCDSMIFETGIPNIWCFLFVDFIGHVFLQFFHEQFFAINPEGFIKFIIATFISMYILFGQDAMYFFQTTYYVSEED